MFSRFHCNKLRRKSTKMISLALALFATAAISSAGAQTKSHDAPSAPPAGLKAVTITDPVHGITAYSLAIPENWIFQGRVIEGTTCALNPLPVFRMSSPDGLTGVKFFPRTDWSWSDDPKQPAASNSFDCLPYKKAISASDFLKNMVVILKVEYVKNLPTPNLAARQKEAAANSTKLLTTTADAANFQVRYHIHEVEIEEHLNALLVCTTDKTSEKAIQHTCSAFISRSWAPQGKWSEDTFAFTQHPLAIDEKWNAAVYWDTHPTPEEIKRRQNPGFGNLDEGRRHREHLELVARLQAEALRKKQYGEFIGAMQRDSGMRATTQNAISATRMPDDWCDYALDREKINDHFIGDTGTVADPPDFNYTWVNEKGDRIQTKNLNDNPNGNGTGNWILQENVAQN
jgi:hypothetical protein